MFALTAGRDNEEETWTGPRRGSLAEDWAHGAGHDCETMREGAR